MDKRIVLSNGGELIPDRMERPFVFVENHEPVVLSLAVKKANDSYVVLIPLRH